MKALVRIHSNEIIEKHSIEIDIHFLPRVGDCFFLTDEGQRQLESLIINDEYIKENTWVYENYFDCVKDMNNLTNEDWENFSLEECIYVTQIYHQLKKGSLTYMAIIELGDYNSLPKYMIK